MRGFKNDKDNPDLLNNIKFYVLNHNVRTLSSVYVA